LSHVGIADRDGSVASRRGFVAERYSTVPDGVVIRANGDGAGAGGSAGVANCDRSGSVRGFGNPDGDSARCRRGTASNKRETAETVQNRIDAALQARVPRDPRLLLGEELAAVDRVGAPAGDTACREEDDLTFEVDASNRNNIVPGGDGVRPDRNAVRASRLTQCSQCQAVRPACLGASAKGNRAGCGCDGFYAHGGRGVSGGLRPPAYGCCPSYVEDVVIAGSRNGLRAHGSVINAGRDR